MNTLLAAAETVQSPGIGGIIDTFGINIYDLAAQAVCFLVLALVLNRFVFKPVMKIVDQRRQEAEDAAANAERIKKELKATEDARSEIIRNAYEHAEKIISETKADAATLREHEKNRTEQLAVQILAKAREESLLGHEKMKIELKNEIAEMIVRLTGVIAEKNIDSQDRERILDSALKALSSEKPNDKGNNKKNKGDEYPIMNGQ
jgi:F-type H+-transporting ATPase subunit b